MERFPCQEWLHITVAAEIPEVTIKIKHNVHHHAYAQIGLSDQWKRWIEANAKNMTPGAVSCIYSLFFGSQSFSQMWQYIQSIECGTRPVSEVHLHFDERAVRYHWLKVTWEQWRLDPDPIKSAQKFISDRGDEHQIAKLDVAAVPGTQVVAFQVKDFVEIWAKNTRELAMDSTCEIDCF